MKTIKKVKVLEKADRRYKIFKSCLDDELETTRIFIRRRWNLANDEKIQYVHCIA